MSDEIGGHWLHRCLCLLILALAVKNPDYKIPDADEREQRSEETPNGNPAPLAEHPVEDQIGPTMQRDVPLPTDVPILESRNRPEKERTYQLSPPRCLQDIQRLSIPRFPLFTYPELDCNLQSISAFIEAVCQKTRQDVNRDSGYPILTSQMPNASMPNAINSEGESYGICSTVTWIVSVGVGV